MRKFLLGLSVIGGLAAIVPASAAVLHPAIAATSQVTSPIVQADWHHRHWAPPHRTYRHHGGYGGRYYR